MRLLELELRAFGPFTGARLDFDGAHPELHIVYGPNEAGKSSALRGLWQALYGIPHNSADDFVHAHKQLRIAAALENGAGQTLRFVRRKGRKNTLRDGNDDEPLDEAELARFLGRIEEAQFRQRFALDHAELIQGGQAIVREDGELGKLLFAAAAGAARLATLEKKLCEEAETIFKSNGKKPRINALLAKLAEAREAVQSLQLSTDAWRQLDRRLRDAVGQKQQLRERLTAASKGKQRLEQTAAAYEKHRQTQAEITSLEQALGILEDSDGLLHQATEITQLHSDRGAYVKSSSERQELVKKQQRLNEQMQAALAALEKLGGDTQTGNHRPSDDKKNAIQSLAGRHGVLAARRKDAEQRLAEFRREEQALTEKLAASPAIGESDELRRDVAQAHRLGDVDQRLAKMTADLRDARAKADLDLRQLPLFSGTLEQLERLAVPDTETVQQYVRESDEAVSLTKQREEVLASVDARLKELERQSGQLRHEHDVPHQRQLTEARQTRDEGWRLVCQAWDGQEDEDARRRTAEFVERFAPGGDLRQAYERCVQDVDALADRLWRQAELVARLNKLESDQRELLSQRPLAEEQLGKARLELEAVRRRWSELWRPAGIKSLTPGEMLPWLERRADLTAQAAAILEMQQEISRCQEQCRECCQLLMRHLPPTEPPDGQIQALLAKVEAQLTDREDQREKRRQLESDLASVRRQIPQAKSLAEDLQQQLAAWQAEWQAALANVDVDASRGPDAVWALVEAREKLACRQEESTAVDRRIDGIDENVQAYSTRARSLAALVARDLLESPVEAAVAELHRRFTTAQGARSRRDELEKQLRRAKENLEAASAAWKELPAWDDSIPSQITRLAGELNDFDRRREELDQSIGGLRQNLSTMDGQSQAAEAEEEVQALLAEIRAESERYARLKVASASLREVVQRFREKHEGPVLTRAGELFAGLTGRSFTALRADYDDRGQAVLLGLRSGGQTVPVNGMSEGARDQLYLALRLASLEHFLTDHEAMPLVVDDILIHFDDDRAAAALEALAQLAHRTQVILFTHHNHLVRLARTTLGEEGFCIHRLDHRGARRSVGRREERTAGRQLSLIE